MTLEEIVSGDFFTSYIKAGDVAMLSEGRQGVDEVCVLSDGLLTIEMDKPTYERCGVVGAPIPDGGRKHVKSRYLVEADLRQPWMLHGKRGFDRLVWAFKNVLNQPKTWLFFDCAAKTPQDAARGPIFKFHPRWFALRPSQTLTGNVRIPVFPRGPLVDSEASKAEYVSPYIADPEFAAELYEWLALVAADSPRVRADDDVDPYLCRYALPDALGGEADSRNEEVRDLARLRWSGFMPSSFVFKIFVAVHTAVRESRARRKDNVDEMQVDGEAASIPAKPPHAENPRRWAALMAHGFRDDHLAVLLPGAGDEFVEWQHQGRL